MMTFQPHSSVVLSMTLAALLAGCATRPSTDPVADLRVATQFGRGDAALNAPQQALDLAVNSPSSDVRAQAWWQGFDDPRLNRLLEQVLARNTDLANAGLRLERARIQAGQTRDALWPEEGVSASVSTTGKRPIDSGAHWTQEDRSSANFSVSWEADLWGKLRGQRDIAQWEAQATAEDLQASLLLLVVQSCERYWQLAYLNQAISTGQANLERLERTAQLVQSRFNVGAASQLEIRQAQQGIQSQRSNLAGLEQQRVEARNALTILLDGQPWPLSDEPQDLHTTRSPEVAEGLPVELLARRPDLRAAELRLRQSLARLKISATNYYPRLRLTGGVGTSSSALGSVLSNPTATLGAGLELPFLNIRQIRRTLKTADVDYQIAANSFRRTLYNALFEVDNALSARSHLVEQVAASQASLEEAAHIMRIQESRYRSGATDLRTWLEAQQTYRSAELSLTQIRRSQLLNDAALYRALGG